MPMACASTSPSPSRRTSGARRRSYFRVADIVAAVAALEARGVVFGERPHVVHRDPSYELWMCFTKDPDGNNIGLMSEVPTAS